MQQVKRGREERGGIGQCICHVKQRGGKVGGIKVASRLIGRRRRHQNPAASSSGLAGAAYSYLKSDVGTSDGKHKNSRREMKDAGWSSYTIQRLLPTSKSPEWSPLQMDIMINGCLIFQPEAFRCKDYMAALIPTEFRITAN